MENKEIKEIYYCSQQSRLDFESTIDFSVWQKDGRLKILEFINGVDVVAIKTKHVITFYCASPKVVGHDIVHDDIVKLFGDLIDLTNEQIDELLFAEKPVSLFGAISELVNRKASKHLPDNNSQDKTKEKVDECEVLFSNCLRLIETAKIKAVGEQEFTKLVNFKKKVSVMLGLEYKD